MNKKDFANVQAFAIRAEQLIEHTTEALANQIASQISLLTNIDPELALSIVEQLEAQKPLIEQAIEERAAKDKGLADEIANKLPPVLEFEEDYEDDEDNGEEAH